MRAKEDISFDLQAERSKGDSKARI